MMSVFLCGLIGGAAAAYFAWPYGWVAAIAAYAFGGALCAMVPAAIEWRQEILRGRDGSDARPRTAVPRDDPHPG